MALLLSGWVALAISVVATWPRLPTGRAWRIGLLTAICAFSVVHQLSFATVAEDAFITFRYSENLATGNGPVFNIGERVEGYSNFLWMVLAAIPEALFGKGIVLAASVLGMVCATGCVVLAYLLTNRLTGGRADGIAAALLVAGASGLAAYGPSGLETPLFVLLVLGVLYALAVRRPFVAGVLVALTGMTRPDGLLIAVFAGGWLLYTAFRGRASWRMPLAYTAGLLLLALPWTIWRVAYYGHLVPNALAAKTGGSLGWQLAQGCDYLTGFAVVSQGFLLPTLVALGVFAFSRRKTDEERASLVWLVCGTAVAYLAFITYAGGDWMPGWRLLAPVPVLLAVAAVAAAGLLPPDKLRVVPLAAAGVCGLSLIVSTTAPQMVPAMHQWRAQIFEMEEFGSLLGANLPPGTVISTYANGALSYRAGPSIRVVDVLGLTDEHIARRGLRTETNGPVGHIAHDYAYVIDVRRPALAVTAGSGYGDTARCTPDPVYQDGYRPANFQREGSGQWATVFVREDQTALIPLLDADPRFTYIPCPPLPPSG
ncbi:hypothetical protein L3Q67_29200 [Saccharothrix sp. AJ9571]|nr:hypothetical protein L3Q67_29200 [Saccharothrix sp. AJ9571]